MTCVTCHDPHHHVEGEELHELQRQQCLQCHEDASCGVPLDQRVERNDNRCVLCHMPRTESGVPHTSTTNHRIAVYADGGSAGSSTDDSSTEGSQVDGQGLDSTQRPTVQVFPLQQLPEDMPQAEVARLNTLGTYWLYRKHMGGPQGAELAQMAGKAMQELVQSGNADAEVFANLAMLTYLQTQLVPAGPEREAVVAGMWQWAAQFAEQALRLESRPTASRQTAMDVVGRYFYRTGQNREAASIFQELVRLRRRKEDWAMLGISLAQLGQSKAGESALRESIRINGGDPDLYESLSLVIGASRPGEATRLESIARRIRGVWTHSPEKP